MDDRILLIQKITGLLQELSEDEFMNFCLMYYSKTYYNSFSQGMTLAHKQRLVLEYAERTQILPNFLENLQDFKKPNNPQLAQEEYLEIGVHCYRLSPTKLREYTSLPQDISVKIGALTEMGTFYLLIRNRSPFSFQNIKIVLEILGYSNSSKLPQSVSVTPLSTQWERIDSRHFVLQNDTNSIIYPEDGICLEFLLNMASDLSRQISMQCTIYSSNLSKPIIQTLEVWPS